MKKLVRIFMESQDLSREEAVDMAKELQEQFYEIMDCGGSYDEVECLLLDYGLEMDYVMDLMA